MRMYFRLFLMTSCITLNIIAHSNYHHIVPRPETNSFTTLISSLLCQSKCGFLHIQTEYGSTYNSGQMAKTILNQETIELAGSQIPSRDPSAIVADYFGLSDGFHSIVSIKPVIHSWQTSLVGQYQFWDEWIAFISVSMGINAHHLNLKEQIADDSQNSPYQQGTISLIDINPNPPFTSFIDASKSLAQASFADKKKSGFLGSRIGIKNICWETEESWGRISGFLTIPAKEDSDTITIFQPSKGFNHHWAIGCALEGSKTVWQNFDHSIAVNGIMDGSYLFKRKTKRTFDFKQNGFLSRYLTLKEFDNGTVTNIVQASTVLTRRCKVSFPLVLDGTLLFTYRNDNFIIGLGYNGFIRSTEKISSIKPIEKNKFGIKGLTPAVDGLTQHVNNSTQSTATISSITNSTDESTIYITTDDLNKKSAATSLSIIHSLCSCFVYKTNTKKNETFIEATFVIEFEGLEERFNNSTSESDPTLFRFGLTGGFIF